MGTAGDGVQMRGGPPLLLKRSDLAPLRHFSEAFEHLEETESLFEGNSETNLLIKSGKWERLLSPEPVYCRQRGELTGEPGRGLLPLFTHPQYKGRLFHGDQKSLC